MTTATLTIKGKSYAAHDVRVTVARQTISVTEAPWKSDDFTGTLTLTGATTETVNIIRRASGPFVPPPILWTSPPPVRYPQANPAQRIRDAEAKRRRQAARQAKGMKP